jgi:hypothetical protein
MERNYYKTNDIVQILGLYRSTVKTYMLEGKIPMCINLEEVKADKPAGYKWDKAKFDTWKLEVWDKQYNQK